jgi:hypothetical protein
VVKQLRVTYSEFVLVALIIQHEMRMHLIVICGISGSKNFSTLSYKRQNVLNVIDHKIVCFES